MQWLKAGVISGAIGLLVGFAYMVNLAMERNQRARTHPPELVTQRIPLAPGSAPGALTPFAGGVLLTLEGSPPEILVLDLKGVAVRRLQFVEAPAPPR